MTSCGGLTSCGKVTGGVAGRLTHSAAAEGRVLYVAAVDSARALFHEQWHSVIYLELF